MHYCAALKSHYASSREGFTLQLFNDTLYVSRYIIHSRQFNAMLETRIRAKEGFLGKAREAWTFLAILTGMSHRDAIVRRRMTPFQGYEHPLRYRLSLGGKLPFVPNGPHQIFTMVWPVSGCGSINAKWHRHIEKVTRV